MNRTIAIFSLAAALAVAALPVRADTGDMIARIAFDDPDYLVTDPSILAGLPAGTIATVIHQGENQPVDIPYLLKDRTAHPYTLVIKIKAPAANVKLPILSTESSKTLDAMVFLRADSKLCLKQRYGDEIEVVSERTVDRSRWTTLAFAFGENRTDVYLDGELILSKTEALAGSRADCYLAGDNFCIGADNDGEDSTLYVADFRIYDGAVAVGDELPGMGWNEEPFRISTAADWALFASNINRGMATGRKFPRYRLEADIGSAAAPITQTVGTDDHPFCGDFDGGSNTIHVAISGSDTGTALFSRTGRDLTYIHNLRVSGSVTSSANYAAGLVGICRAETNMIHHCDVSVDVTVSGAGHAGGIVGHGGSDNELSLFNDVFSGAISGFTGHAGGILGWCESLRELEVMDLLFKGSFSPASSGKYHPIACKSNDSDFQVYMYGREVCYLNNVTPTEDVYNIILEGMPVSDTLVPNVWDMAVTAADGNVYYMRTATSITPETEFLELYSGNVASGTGGADTHLVVANGATVTLSDVCITNITGDADHNWSGITCRGDATKTSHDNRARFYRGRVENCRKFVYGNRHLLAGAHFGTRNRRAS